MTRKEVADELLSWALEVWGGELAMSYSCEPDLRKVFVEHPLFGETLVMTHHHGMEISFQIYTGNNSVVRAFYELQAYLGWNTLCHGISNTDLAATRRACA